MENKKECIKCGYSKTLSEFRKSNGYKDGYTNKCKKCLNLYDRELRSIEQNKELKKTRDKTSYEKNNDDILEYHKLYYQNNKEKCRERNKKWKNAGCSYTCE